MDNNERHWYYADENNLGIRSIAFENGRIVGYNGISKGEWVLCKKDNKEYAVVMVSRLGDFGLSETGELPYTIRVKPLDVYSI